MPAIYNGQQTPMEAAAIAARYNNLLGNTYKSSPGYQYESTHTRAVHDSTTPIYGKGSGQFLDIYNYGGVGGEWDINGNQANSMGSGRNPELTLNASLWGYGPSQVAGSDYTQPNTAANLGQVHI